MAFPSSIVPATSQAARSGWVLVLLHFSPWHSPSSILTLALLEFLLPRVSVMSCVETAMGRTKAFMVPWRACRWFRRNLGSVPFKEGYREVLGFLMLCEDKRPDAGVDFHETYPFRCALRDWLCCDEFFDSMKHQQSVHRV